MAETVSARVDRSRCTATGWCAAMAPGDFSLEAGGTAVPLRSVTTLSEELKEAAEMCPVEAISVHETDGGRRVAPVD